MRIEQLKFFLALFKHRSFHAAAHSLGMTQQALSSSIKSLEQEFGVTLIKRSKAGCTLTADGELFLNYARKTLDDHERLRTYFNGKNSGQAVQKTLDIIFTNTFLSTCVSGAISAFSHEYPDIKIHVEVMNDQKMGEYIRNNKKKDYLFLRSVPFYEDGKIVRDFMPEGFDIQLIKKNYYVACVSKASILAGEQEISINKILDFPMVLSSEKWQGCTPLLHVLRQYKTPNVIMTTPSFFSWAQSVAQNVGIGFTQEIFVQIDIIRKVLAESIHLIRLKEHIGAYLGVILPPKPSTEVQYFHNKITSSLADPNWIY